MRESEEFAHGYHFGDYSGVIFHCLSAGGTEPNRLAVSDLFIGPLFRAILGHRERVVRASSLVSDWDTLTGWASAGGPIPISSADAAKFADALGRLEPADLAGHCADDRADDCIQCARVIREFIFSRLSRGHCVLIEAD